MLRFLCTKFLLLNPKASNFNHNGLYLSSFILRPISQISKSTEPHSFTVSYLQKSCGLSQESAISASKKISIENPEKADSFLKLMKTHGLSEYHLKKIIEGRPSLLVADLEHRIRPNLELFESLGISGTSLGKSLCKEPFMLVSKATEFVEFFRSHNLNEEAIRMIITKRPPLFQLSPTKNFKPKLEFLRSIIGLSDEEVTRVLCSATIILERSLKNRIIPCSQVLRKLFGADILRSLKLWRFVVRPDLVNILESNVSFLKSQGVPDSSISMMFKIQPSVLLIKLDRLKEILEEVVKLGFNQNSKNFVLAIRSLVVIGMSTWEQKLEAFENYGLSTVEIYSAFKLQPMIMLVSMKKIERLMGFYMEKLEMRPSDVCKHPHLLQHSFEKRIVPRCSVLQILTEKNILNREIRVSTYLRMSEKRFLEKTVSRFEHVIPEVVKANNGELVFQDFPNVLWLRK